jgi:hypothetical protein
VNTSIGYFCVAILRILKTVILNFTLYRTLSYRGLVLEFGIIFRLFQHQRPQIPQNGLRYPAGLDFNHDYKDCNLGV